MSIQIDFYILPEKTEQNYLKSNQLLVACQLSEKAFLLSQSVYLCCESESQAIELDQLLWKFKQNAFIPHSIEATQSGEQSLESDPVLISQKLPNKNFDLIINLSQQLVDIKAVETERILEIVDFENKPMGRKKYKHYLSQQQKPNTHEIN